MAISRPVSALLPSGQLFCLPDNPNSNLDPLFLLFFREIAILAYVFCHFAFRNSQIAFLAYVFCYFLEKWQFRPLYFAIYLEPIVTTGNCG